VSTHTVDRLHLAVLDGHLLDDATLARLVPECRSLTAFTTDAEQSGLAQRWAAIAPGTELIDGGHVADLREAMVECAKRRIVVISTGVPKDPATFVARALQGAAAMTEFDIPGVAVHVMRPVERPGTVAWLTDTGELSGYGVLFAVGYAHLHGTGLDLIEPTGGLDRPRTAEALDDALAFADAAGVPITRHTDPSPFARVLRDPHCLVVHPVLDAPKGFNLLHPGELSRKAVASGNPAVVVELIEQFPGDVVAVFDGVHLLSGAIPAARIAAGVALGVVAAAGIGTMVASPASAATMGGATGNTAVVMVEGDWFRVITDVVSGLTFTAGSHSGSGTALVIHNNSGHTATLEVTGFHGHGGGEAFQQTVTVTAGQSVTVQADQGGVKRWGPSVVTAIDGQQIPHIQVTDTTGTPVRVPPTQVQVVAQQLTPVVVTGTEVTTQTLTEGGGLVVAEPTTETELQTIEPGTVTPPPLTVPPPTVIETPGFTVTGPSVPGPEQKVDAPVLVPHVLEEVTSEQGPVVVPGPEQRVDAPVLVPQVLEEVTPEQGPVVVPGPEQRVDAPVLVPQVLEEVTPEQGPVVVPGPEQKVDEPVLVPQVPEEVTPEQGPEVVPGPEQKVDEPALVPQVPDLGTPVALPNPQVPGPEQKVDEPVLIPPVRDTISEMTQSSVVGTVMDTLTPEGVVEIGGPVVSPGVMSDVMADVTIPTETGMPGIPGTTTTDTGVVTTGGHGPTPSTTHHHTTPSGLAGGMGSTDHQAPEGELAHTGGNTAILAIVAGSLLAAGAGLAVAGRMGKDEADPAAP
jgi:hypothetical protein